jgi:hypothetical protein
MQQVYQPTSLKPRQTPLLLLLLLLLLGCCTTVSLEHIRICSNGSRTPYHTIIITISSITSTKIASQICGPDQHLSSCSHRLKAHQQLLSPAIPPHYTPP